MTSTGLDALRAVAARFRELDLTTHLNDRTGWLTLLWPRSPQGYLVLFAAKDGVGAFWPSDPHFAANDENAIWAFARPIVERWKRGPKS